MTPEQWWQQTEAAATPSGPGQLRRRVRPELPFDLFVALERPANRRVLLLEASAEAIGDEVAPLKTRGVELKIDRLEQAQRATLELRLLDASYASIFTMLVEDLIGSVTGSPAEREAVASILGRLQRWRRFLERSGPEGLRREEQRGLYGELWLLLQYLIPALGSVRAVKSWTGPDGTNQDFQLRDRAIEVKTTVGRQPQKLIIASERQLDDTGVEVLLLMHLSLDERQDGRNTLPLLIDQVRLAVQDQEGVVALLGEKLLEVGYLDAHRPLYETIGYTVRETGVFRVVDGFPRITERGLPVGVGGVRYAVALAACVPFAVPLGELTNAIGDAGE